MYISLFLDVLIKEILFLAIPKERQLKLTHISLRFNIDTFVNYKLFVYTMQLLIRCMAPLEYRNHASICA